MPKQSSGGSRHFINNTSRGSLADPQTYGMLLWQSKLQDQLLQEQKEKRLKEKEDAERLNSRQSQTETEENQEREEAQKKNETVFEIPQQMMPGPASYMISHPTPSRGQSPNPNRKDSSGNHRNGHNLAQGMFPNIANNSRIRTSVSCDNFGKPPVMPQSLLGSIVSFQQMGGAGSPRRTPSGKLITALRGDPEIRYHQKDTRAFDQTIRYQMDREKVQEYRRQLDSQLEDQRQWRARYGSGQIKEITRRRFIENINGGGDGYPFNSNSHSHTPHQYQQQQSNRNGTELAPLIRKFNSLPKLNTLSSTDENVANNTFLSEIRALSSPRNEFFHPVQPDEVAQSLSTQLREKKYLQNKQRERDNLETERHFETWDRFWGRPGCGAPIPFTNKSMGHAVSFANLYENPKSGHTFPQHQNGGGLGYNRVNLFKALHMTHQQPNRPK